MRGLVLGVAIAAFAALAQAADRGAEPAAGPAEPQQEVLVLLRIPAAHFRADGNYASGYADAAGRSARRRIAASLARTHGLDMVTDWPLPILRLDCYVMRVPDERRAEDVAGQLSRDPRVERAQAMNVFRALGHDDPLFSLQPAARQWQLADLHAVATGRGVRVAVIDSAVQLDHPDLSGQVESSQNLVADRPYVAENHGTAVAGIIAARADNHIGIAGIAPQARLLALRACWQESTNDSRCTSLSLALALHAAVERGAQVINLSLGGPSDRLVQQLIDVALARGIAVVAASDRAAPRGGFPAALNGVIAVADDTPGAPPSGTWIAPGRDVPTTLPASRWSTVSGASYAAAHVSGLLALMIDLHARSGRVGVSLSSELVARPDGRIDACASLVRAGAACACTCGAAPAQESIARH